MSSLEKLDLNLLIYIEQIFKNPFFDKAMPIMTWLGNLGIIWMVIALILMSKKQYRRVGIMCIAALILTSFLGEGVLKNIFQRSRPFNEMNAVQLLIPKPSSYSFPSGHTSSSFAAAGVLSSQIKKLTIPSYILAILIAFSRLYLLVHFPSDVIGGIILGLVSAKIILIAFNKWVHDEKYR